ncbi:uncharacterized protein BDZ99DRAFT_480103 [Mytilinidion resinicola]|uniref:Uncharacterized protein n=1 Tax=Mytilinidion resinicola TaxID=574789 RepID=A0A6A6YE43_9PEZI|nr:uncharacterized protein BDZ99DRAFT_480103 [Mytilinidion resinicola]KAF2806117.1 hypothetical protein BDZ99DRAFT_480103 [Mytilinidion resinicola]
MSLPSDGPTLGKPYNPTAEGDQFLAFLNLGKKTEQKTAEDKGSGSEMEKQKLEAGASFSNHVGANSLTSRRARVRLPQKDGFLEKRKREDVPEPTECGDDEKMDGSYEATPYYDLSMWDFEFAGRKHYLGMMRDTKNETAKKTEIPSSCSFDPIPPAPWLEELGHTEKNDIVGAKIDAPPISHGMPLNKETNACVDSELSVQDHQDNDTTPDAVASSSQEDVEQGEQTHDHSSNHSQPSSIDESPLTPEEELIIIDPEGDLRITIGTTGNEITALCSSPCVRRASPKWKALIDASPNEIHLEEDIGMVLDLLRIAHAQFGGLPDHTVFNELLVFAHICHIYEVTELVRPWMHNWVDPWMKKGLDSGFEGCIFIAWIFGYEETFEALTHRLASTATKSKVRIPDIVLEVFDLELRTIIVDNILRIRNLVIPDLISICNSQVTQLADVRSRKSCLVSDKCLTEEEYHSELCDCIALGSLQRSLNSIGIWPPYPCPDTSSFTIQSLQAQLDDFSVLSYPDHEEYHKFCYANEDFHHALRVERKQVSALQVAHKEHFESFSPMVDPSGWKNKAVEKLGLLERESRTHESDSESDEAFHDPELKPEDDDPENGADEGSFIDPETEEEYDEDEDEDYEESDEDSDSEPDEEYLDSGEESDYTSDVEEEESVEERFKAWMPYVPKNESVEEQSKTSRSRSEVLGSVEEDSTVGSSPLSESTSYF